MGTFAASLRAIGDVDALPATVELEDGQLSIASGETSIGSWALTDIKLEPIPTGYRMAAEGDQILIELKDVESFQQALDSGKKRKLRMPSRKAKENGASEPSPGDQRPATRPKAPVAEASTPKRPERAVTLPAKQESTPSAEPKPKSKIPKGEGQSLPAQLLAGIDGTLHRARKRYGPYLPPWVFTRAMFGILVAAVVLMFFLPGLISAILLVAGGLTVLLGAVAYSDPMIASKWLPGRTQPNHVLLAGLAFLMLGVLLGLIAN